MTYRFFLSPSKPINEVCTRRRQFVHTCFDRFLRDATTCVKCHRLHRFQTTNCAALLKHTSGKKICGTSRGQVVFAVSAEE